VSDFAQSVDPVINRLADRLGDPLVNPLSETLPAPALTERREDGPDPSTEAATAEVSATLNDCLHELWQSSNASRYGIGEEEFAARLLSVGRRYGFGHAGEAVSEAGQTVFLLGLRIADLVLAWACAAGHEAAWERFFELYREAILRAACAIAREESAGRELADSVYGWLFGIRETAAKEGEARRSPLISYAGRGSLAGWLRTVLAQRFVDTYRRTRHETSLEEQEETLALAAAEAPAAGAESDAALVARAVSAVLEEMDAEDSFLLTAYYLDQRTLQQMARMMEVHESTVSRRLARLTKALRKQLMKRLQAMGLDRRTAEEALGVDVRDVNVDIRKILQIPAAGAFPEQRAAENGGKDE
jgi:RNA polymerase sigma-70 factor (ECF subfamily)